MIKLVVSDVDGTLVQPDKSLSEGTRAAAARLQAAGIRLTVVSARPPKGVHWVTHELHLDSPYAGFNGGAIVAADGTMLEWNPAPPDLVQKAMALFDARGVDTWLFTRDEWLIRDPNGVYVPKERGTVRFDPRVVLDFAPYMHEVGKLCGVTDDFDKLAAVEKELQAIVGDNATAHRSQQYYLDLTHKHANKGYAVQALARHLAIDTHDIAVLGDMSNDIPMFRVAGFSIAMGNGSDEVKAAATTTTDANTNEGWAHAIDRLIPAQSSEHRLLYALALMCDQYLTTRAEPGNLDHVCMTAGECAAEVLFEHGLITPHFRGGTWTEAGKALLASKLEAVSPPAHPEVRPSE